MTPEQIAQAIADDHDFAAVEDLRSPEQVHDMITQAIHADRSQRAEHNRKHAERIAQDALDQRCLDDAVQIMDIAQVLDAATAAALTALTAKETTP